MKLRAGLKKTLLAALIPLILVLSLKLATSRSSWGPLVALDRAITTAYSYAARYIVYPIDAARGLFSRLAAMWQAADRAQRIGDLEAELQRLKIELDQLKSENKRLCELLNLAQRTASKTVAARVIDRTTSPRRTIVVD
ncbi:MAG TPA: hypothetical protein ENF73_05430, partial [Proteobacteria bacterium]|nr:hypothetical protein [Pseudomonadota bacterium]